MIKKDEAQADTGGLPCGLPGRQLNLSIFLEIWPASWTRRLRRLLPGAARSLCHPLSAERALPKWGLKHLRGIPWG